MMLISWGGGILNNYKFGYVVYFNYVTLPRELT